jgi:hypothetical protein
MKSWIGCGKWRAAEVSNVNVSKLPQLRQLAREMGISPAALRDAVECGLFVDDETPVAWAGELRQMRRLMDALGVNAPGAALLIRMQRDMDSMERQLVRLQRLEASWYDAFEDGFWYDLVS